MNSLLTKFIRNSVFANIALVLILFAALLATKTMIRETWPEFRLDIAIVSVSCPGADPEEVEEGICRKIEDALIGVEGIKEVRTSSSEGGGTAVIELFEKADPIKTMNIIRNRIDSISTFPRDAERPVIEDLVLKDPVIMLSVGGALPPEHLKEWSNDIKDELQRMPELSQVAIMGDLPYEVSIEISEERLRALNLTFAEVAQAVQAGNLNYPCGTLRTIGQEWRLRMLERRYTAEEIGGIVVRAAADGPVITLNDIASVRDTFEDIPLICEVNGEPGIYIIISKTAEQDALHIAKIVHDWRNALSERLPEGAHVDVVYDLTEELSQRIDLLVRNGLSGLLLVFLMLWLFLDSRVSLWVSVGLVTGIGAGLVVLWTLGGTINMVSLFALIMVLGILVDDGIVIGEAIYTKRCNGTPGLRAAVEAVAEMGMPVIAAVATTIIAFVPLLFIGGIMGKFIRILPTVVIACLAASLIECLFILPAHLAHGRVAAPEAASLPRWRRWFTAIPNRTNALLIRFVERIYIPFIRRALNWSYVSLCALVSILLLTIGLVAGGFIKYEMFPEADGFVLTATVEFPGGTPLAVTEEAIRHIERAGERAAAGHLALDGGPIILSRPTLIGASMGETDAGDGPHVGSVQLILVDSSQRAVHSKELMIAWEKEIGRITGAENVTLEGISMGPAGAAIEIELKGRDMKELLASRDLLQEKLQTYEGVYQIRSDYRPGKDELRFRLKPEAHALGITPTDLATHLSAGYYGMEPLRLQRGRDEVRIKIRYPENERHSLADLDRILISTPDGASAPLSAIATIELTPGAATINRAQGLRRIVVSAKVDTTLANAEEIAADLAQNIFPALSRSFPSVHPAFAGEHKKTAESFNSLKVGFPLAIMGIYIIIAAMFRSYVQPLLILFTVPFGLIGSILGHLILGHDLSMMSMFGMIALAGVVVNDAIVLIEAFNENLARQMPFTEALIEACRSRFRAVFLTTITTIGGLAPLIMERSYQAQFIIPMAVAIAAGLLFATLLTLIILPNLLIILNDLRLIPHFIVHKKRLPREAVEPASRRYEEL
jgi:multidrug efflux pump subunit AcrB